MKRKMFLQCLLVFTAVVFLIAQVGWCKKEEEAAPAAGEAVDVSGEEYVAVHALSSYPISSLRLRSMR